MIELRAFTSKNGERSALGQGIAWNPGKSDIAVWVVSVPTKVLACTTPRKEEKRKAYPQTSYSAAEEWTRLSFCREEKGQTDSSQACNPGILAVAKGVGRAKEASTDGRLLLYWVWNRGFDDYRSSHTRDLEWVTVCQEYSQKSQETR